MGWAWHLPRGGTVLVRLAHIDQGASGRKAPFEFGNVDLRYRQRGPPWLRWM